MTTACLAFEGAAQADVDDDIPPLVTTRDAPSSWSSPTGAAEYHVHDGFYFRGSLGYAGSYDLSRQQGSGGMSANGTAYPAGLGYELLFGGTLPVLGRGSLVLGGGLEVVTSRGASVGYLDGNPAHDLSTIAPVAFADYYPSARGGLHLQALAGTALAFSQCHGPCFSDDTATGVLMGAGAGYDVWISRKWSVGVLGRVQYAHLIGSDTRATHDALMPTLSLSFAYN